jgi:hypothetical protein
MVSYGKLLKITGVWMGILSMLGGCAGATVAVPTNFPVPLVQKFPLDIGVHLSSELTDFAYEQDLGQSGEFRIELGAAQESMFQNLFTGMFDKVVLVEDPKEGVEDVAGVIVPEIVELQFSTPAQTRSDYFEVWIRYKFELFSRDGQLLGDWPLMAYGKANTQNYGLSPTQPTLRAAALAACRDAMAFFTVNFRSIPTVQRWLAAELLGGSI